MRWATNVSAYSSTVANGSTGEFKDMKRIGLSEGLDLRKLGGEGIPGGSCGSAAEIAVCTSCAAASMLRLRSNCRVIEVDPSVLVELTVLSPALVENCRSSGVATEDAIVSGLPPGSWAVTWMVG